MNEEKKVLSALHERCGEYVRCEDPRRLEVLEEIKQLLFQASLEDGYYDLLRNLDNQRHAYQDSMLVEV